jgi:hypothetical protein
LIPISGNSNSNFLAAKRREENIITKTTPLIKSFAGVQVKENYD